MKLPGPSKQSFHLKAINICVALLGGLFFILSSSSHAAAESSTNSPARGAIKESFYVWAYTGPNAYLSRATITIRDNRGRVIARGKTNRRGIVQFQIPKIGRSRTPLQVVSTGGYANGRKFLGMLRAEASTIGIEAHAPIIYLDLISTAAKLIERKAHGYSSAMGAVRWSLGIGKGATAEVLRVQNSHVDNGRLQQAVHRSGGYISYTKELARAAQNRQRVTGLTPYKTQLKPFFKTAPLVSVGNKSQRSASQNLSADVLSSSSSSDTTATTASTVCTTQIPNGSGTSASTMVVTNFGRIASNVLFQYMGIPTSAINGVTGMLFSFIPSGTSPTVQALTNISNELDCISAQISAISEQIDELQFTTDLTAANQCQSNIATQWQIYNGLVASYIDSPSEINASNPNVSSAAANFNAVATSCGSNIVADLFGTTGDPDNTAWLELNSIYKINYSWYTQVQNQSLQYFLAFWSTALYQQSVLANEYYNFSNLFTTATIAAGSVGGGSSQCSSSYSAVGSLCYQQANIQSSFPGNLYSDEAGIYQTGLAVNAYPGGSAIAGGSPQQLNAYTLGSDAIYSSIYSFPASTWANSAYSNFNGSGINPAGNSTATETWSSPQAFRTQTVASSDVSALTATQSPNGTSPSVGSISQFFLNSINQVGSWSGLSSSDVAFYTSDNTSTVSVVSYTTGGDTYAATTNFGNWNGSKTTTVSCILGGCFPPTGSQPISGYQYPIMGILLGRAWTEPAAASYTYSTLPTTLPFPPSAPALLAATAGAQQITLSFSAPSTQGSTAISGYLATCTTSTGLTYANTGNPYVTSITISELTSGASYSCTVQAQQESGGISAFSNALSATPTAPPILPPGAPTLTSISTTFPANATTASMVLSFTPSSTGGSANNFIGVCDYDGASVYVATALQSPITIPAPPNTEFVCNVYAEGSGGVSAYSNYEFITTPASSSLYSAVAAPGAPTITSLSSGSGSNPSFTISFIPPSTGGTPTNYVAFCINSSNAIVVAATSATSPITATVPAGVTVSCAVAAENLSGAQTYSSLVPLPSP